MKKSPKVKWKKLQDTELASIKEDRGREGGGKRRSQLREGERPSERVDGKMK